MLLKTYPDELWDAFVSANDPILIGVVTADNLNHVDKITTELKLRPAILYSEAFYYRPASRYKSIKRLGLEEAVRAAGP